MDTNGHTTTETAIALRQPTAMAAFEPRTFDQAMAMAEKIAKSGLLGDLNTPEKVFLVMATGAELGIPLTAALRGIHIIKGKAVTSADLKVSLCLRRPDLCEFFRLVSSTDEEATYETKRAGCESKSVTFRMKDAERAQLIKDDSNWKKYPRVMLRHRAASELATAVYPDLVMGVYAEEEREEIEAGAAPSVIVSGDVQPLSQVVDAEPVDFAADYLARLGDCADLAAVDALSAEAVSHYGKGKTPDALKDATKARRSALKGE